MMFGEWMLAWVLVAQAPQAAPLEKRIEQMLRSRLVAATSQPAATSRPAVATTRPVDIEQRLRARLGAGLSGIGKVEFMPVGSGIAIIGEDQDVEALSQIIALLDQEIKPLELRLFPLENARAAQVGPRLQRIFQQIMQVPGRRPRPEDRVIVVPDERSNVLIIAAAPERFAKIEQVIKTLDKPAIEKMEFRPFPLQHIDAPQAKEKLERMLKQSRQALGITGPSSISIEADERNRMLIIQAPPKEFAQIEKLLKMIDVPPKAAVAEVVVIPLVRAKADPLARVLNEIIATRAGAGRGQAKALGEQIRRLRLKTKEGAELPELDLEKPIRIIADDGSNSLLIGSTPDNLVAMKEIVKLFDTVPVDEEMFVRVFPLEHADAGDVAKMLTNLFKQGQRLSQRPGGRKLTEARVPKGPAGKAMAYNVAVAADVRTNTVIVSGRIEQVLTAQEIIHKVDVPGLAAKFPIRLIFLEHTDATRIQTVIRNLMQQRLDALKKLGPAALERERVFIEADIRSNALIVSAKEDNFKEIEQLAKKLDTLPEKLLGQIRILTLKNLTATDLASKIEQLWERRAKLRKIGGVPEDRPVIVADQRSNALIIASNPEDFEAIARLVSQLEMQELAPIHEIRLIELKHNDASAIARMLQTLFERRMRNRLARGQQEQPSDRVFVTFDAATNTLLVAASKENYDEMVRIIQKLDVELPTEGVVRTFFLENADATTVQGVLADLFRQGLYKPSAGLGSELSKAREKVAMAVDARANAIIVSASRENFQIIEDLIKRLDSVDAPRLIGNVGFFKVEHADAVSLADKLQKLLDGLRKASPGQKVEPPSSVLALPRRNILIVAGSRDAIRRVGELLKHMDVPLPEPSTEVQVYGLRYASSERLAPMIETVLENQRPKEARTPYSIQADPGSNSLVVTASREDHETIKHLLTLLDKESTVANRVAIFPLQKARAEDLADIIRELISQQQKLGAGRRGKAGAGAATVAAITPDARTNSLVVWAAPSEMDNIKTIIERLDTSEPKATLVWKVIRLRRADAEELADLINSVLLGEGTTGRGRGRRAPRGGAAADRNRAIIVQFLEQDAQGNEIARQLIRQDITIVPDIRTNSLIILAPPESVAMLEALIVNLDKIEPIFARVRVFTLQNADAEDMVKTLEELFGVGKAAKRRGEQQPERRLIFGPQGVSVGPAGGAGGETVAQELTFTVDKRTNSVIAAGSQEYLELVAQLIEQLDRMDIEERINRVVRIRFGKAEEIQAAISKYYEEQSKLAEKAGEAEALRRQVEREVTVVANEASNDLIVSVSPRYESRIMELIHQLDQPPPQVMIQVLLAEVTLDDRVELGLEFAVQDLLFTETAHAGPNGTVQGNNFDFVVGTDVGAAGGAGALGGFSFTITGEDFNFLLRALQSDRRLEVLSRPQIMVQDNKEANIIVGENVPFPTGTTIVGGQTQTQVEYRDVGIELNVTPHINPDGYVNMDIEPSIEAITESTVPIAQGLNAPIFTKRSAQTSITVKDGETVVIGGLITSRDEETEDKVPLLGDIPGLGLLFRASRHSKLRTELLIVMTPRVVRTLEEMRALAEEERDKMDLLPDSIRQSPLMEGLQVGPGEQLLGPGEEAEEPTPPETETYVPTPEIYGPPKPLGHSSSDAHDDAPPEPVGAVSLSEYLGQPD